MAPARIYNRDDSRSANLFASNQQRLGEDAAQLQPVQRRDRRPDLQEQDVLHVLVREAAGRHDRVVHAARCRRRGCGRATSRSCCRIGVQIYDPTHRAPGERRRRARSVPGQHHPGRPNQPRGAQRPRLSSRRRTRRRRADFSQNFFAEQPWTYAYNFQMVRIDHEWTAGHRTYGRFIRNFRREERFNFAGEMQGVEITRGATDRFNFNYALGHTAVLSPTHGVRPEGQLAALQRRSVSALQPSIPASLGFSCSTARAASATTSSCRASASSRGRRPTAGRVARLGAQQSGFNSGRTQPFYNVQIAPTLTKTDRRAHLQVRIRLAAAAPGRNQSGMERRRIRVRRHLHPRDQRRHQPVWPGHCRVHARAFRRTRRSSKRAATTTRAVNSHGAFVHDDWRVSDRLTLNLGLRYDLELGLSEVENRNIGGFDLTTSNPIEAQARAQLRGQSAGRRADLGDAVQRARRIHVSVGRSAARVERGPQQLPAARRGSPTSSTRRTVLRGGVGLFIAPFQIQGVPGITTGLNQIGYSRNTPVPVTSDNGLTFQANLTQPGSERAAAGAGRIELRACDQSRERARAT